jgi:O-antigen/teichoic acid export membrane protein
VIRFAAPVSIPLAVFYAARPTIDALREAPVTTVLLVGSLVVEVVATYGAARAMPAWQASVAGFGAAAVVLAASSYIAMLRAIPVPASRSKP